MSQVNLGVSFLVTIFKRLLGGQALLRCDRWQIPPPTPTFTTLEGYSHVQTYTNLCGFVEVVWSHGDLCLVVASWPLSCKVGNGDHVQWTRPLDSCRPRTRSDGFGSFNCKTNAFDIISRTPHSYDNYWYLRFNMVSLSLMKQCNLLVIVCVC